MSVTLKFKEQSGDVFINEKVYAINNHCVNLTPTGWTLLKIKSTGDKSFNIADILIEQISISNMRLIMFNEVTGECNFGWIGNQNQIIPLHENYSIFRRTISQFIDQGDFGRADLYKKYDFGFRQTPVLTHTFPKHVQDYFQESVSPTWHKKWSKRSAWFTGFPIDKSRVLQEVIARRDLFVPRKINADSYAGWEDISIDIKSVSDLSKLGFTYLVEILRECKFEQMKGINFGFLPPGGFIDSHKDLKSGERETQKIYIPVDSAPGNYFKFIPGGYVPLESENVICVNTDECVHSVINDSDRGRFIVGLRGFASWN
jgi:hypothetical protein